jgi:hypothetical protein
VSAAEAYFESWGRALHAPGIDPNLYFVRRKWREQTKKAMPASQGQTMTFDDNTLRQLLRIDDELMDP